MAQSDTEHLLSKMRRDPRITRADVPRLLIE